MAVAEGQGPLNTLTRAPSGRPLRRTILFALLALAAAPTADDLRTAIAAGVGAVLLVPGLLLVQELQGL